MGSFVLLPSAGVTSVTPVGAVVSIVNVDGKLKPVLLTESSCSARAVYVPSARPAESTDQVPEEAVVLRVSTGVPVAVEPA